MKSIRVQGYDATVNFPDDTPDSTIQSVLKKKFPETDDMLIARFGNPDTPSHALSREDFSRYLKVKPEMKWADVPGIAMDAAAMTAGLIAEGLPEAIKTYGNVFEPGTAARTFAEGAARGAYDSETLVKMSNNYLRSKVEAFGGTSQNEEGDQYKRFIGLKELQNIRGAIERGEKSAWNEYAEFAGMEGLKIDESKINTKAAELTGEIVDPATFLPATKVGSMMAKGATKALSAPMRGLGKGLSNAADATRAGLDKATAGIKRAEGALNEATGGLGNVIVPGGIGAAVAAGVVGKGTLGLGAGVVAAPTIMDVAGGLLTGFGEAMAHTPTRLGGLGRLALNKPDTRAGKLAGRIKWMDRPAEYAGRAAAGVGIGAGVGAGLGAVSGGLEGMAQGIGSGGVLGGLGGGFARSVEGLTGANRRKAQDSDFDRWVSKKDPVDRNRLQSMKSREDRMIRMDAEEILLGAGATVQHVGPDFVIDEKGTKLGGSEGFQRVEGGKPVVYLNTNADAGTMSHEVFHALARLDGFDVMNSNIKSLHKRLHSPEELNKFIAQYESKLKSEIPLTDEMKSRMGSSSEAKIDYILEELGAEYFKNLISGKNSDYIFSGNSFAESLKGVFARFTKGKLDRVYDTFDSPVLGEIKKTRQMDRMMSDLIKARRKAGRDVELSVDEPVRVLTELDLSDDAKFREMEAMGVAKVDSKGKRVVMGPSEQKRVAKDRTKKVTEILDKVSDDKDGMTKQPDGSYKGQRFSAGQLEALMKSPEINDTVKNAIIKIQAIADGDQYANWTYAAALMKTKKGLNRYRNLPISNRDAMLYDIIVSPSAGTMAGTMLDMSMTESRARRLYNQSGAMQKLFGSEAQLFQDLHTYINALTKGEQRTADVLGSQRKSDFLSKILGVRNVKGNPEIPDTSSMSRAERGRAEGAKNHPWRSFRLDRIVAMKQKEGRPILSFSEDAYSRGQVHFSPASRNVVDIQRDLAKAVKELGLKSKKYDVAEYLSKRSAELGKLEELSPENAIELGDAIYAEAAAAVAKDRDAIGWYDRKMDEAMGYIHELHPELNGNPSLDSLMKSFIAITSNGQNVNDNFKRGEFLYNHYKKTGKILTDADWGGKAKHAINKGLSTLESLVSDLGLDGARDLMLQKVSVKELNGIMAKYGIEKAVSGELGDQYVIGAMFMGPKIGSFFGNLNKLFDSVTMDRWFMRTINRMRGILTDAPVNGIARQTTRLLESMKGKRGITLIKKELTAYNKALAEGKSPRLDSYKTAHKFLYSTYRAIEGRGFKNRTETDKAVQRLYQYASEIKEAPSGGGERKWIRDAMDHAQSRLRSEGIHLTNADLQAVLWYWEKDLYQGFGVGNKRSERADYAEAARQLLGSRRQGIGTGRRGSPRRDTQDASTQAESNVDGDPESQTRFSPSQRQTPEFKSWFSDSKVADVNGEPTVVYSGHANVAMFGNKWDTKKATSGGFYFTEDPNIANSYAMGKMGNYESFEGGEQYRLLDKKGNPSKKISSRDLTPAEQRKASEFIEENAGMDPNKYWKDNARYEDTASQALRSGGMRRLSNIHGFLESMGENIAYDKHDPTGQLPRAFKQTKNTFEGMLDHLGIEWNSSERSQPGVYPVYLSIKNPIDAAQPFPQAILTDLQKAAKRERVPKWKEHSNTQWTKDMPLRDFVEQIESGSEYWTTQVPAKAKKIFKDHGVDGIKELGMKGAEDGVRRQVNWIAFDAGQIKSATGNKGSFNPSNADIRFSPAKVDTDHAQAVKSGDTATAQKLVDEAAQKAGYTVGPVNHGTTHGGFNRFKIPSEVDPEYPVRGAFFTTSDAVSSGFMQRSAYDKDTGNNPKNYKTYIKLKEPLRYQQQVREYSTDSQEGIARINRETIDDLADFLDDNPEATVEDYLYGSGVTDASHLDTDTLSMYFDGIIDGEPGNEMVVVATRPDQIKSADPATYDNQDNLIPLSERFDIKSDDIRFSPSRQLNKRGGAIYTTEQGHRAIQTSSRAGVRVYGKDGKRIGPVFASVEKAERHLSKQ